MNKIMEFPQSNSKLNQDIAPYTMEQKSLTNSLRKPNSDSLTARPFGSGIHRLRVASFEGSGRFHQPPSASGSSLIERIRKDRSKRAEETRSVEAGWYLGGSFCGMESFLGCNESGLSGEPWGQRGKDEAWKMDVCRCLYDRESKALFVFSWPSGSPEL